METMRIIYKMLRYLEKMMRVEEPDYTPIMPEALGIPRSMWLNVLEIMTDEGFIKGVTLVKTQEEMTLAEPFRAKITLAGLEYLGSNSAMKKAARAAKGISEVIGGVI